MSTVEELKESLNVDDDGQLDKIFGVSKQAVSKWRVNGIPAKVTLKAQGLSGHAISMIVNGDNHIESHHAHDGGAPYGSPATSTLLDSMKDWSENKRRKLLGVAISWNGDEEEEV